MRRAFFFFGPPMQAIAPNYVNFSVFSLYVIACTCMVDYLSIMYFAFEFALRPDVLQVVSVVSGRSDVLHVYFLVAIFGFFSHSSPVSLELERQIR